MTDEKKAELRALLKPGSPELTDEQYENLSKVWDECVRRYNEAVGVVPALVHTVDDLRRMKHEIIGAAIAIGCEPYDPAKHGEFKVTLIR